MIICKDFKFDAAHNLTAYKGQCEKLHGHTYLLSVSVSGTKNKETGLVVDFLELKNIVNTTILQKLDHSYLNDFFSNPTAETVAEWVFSSLKPLLESNTYHLYEVKLSETTTSHVIIKNQVQ
ncbi:MAG: 6-carboxytetrahydropterin synthase QueD [Caldisericia bacterium]|nr:6-carboxytetrahydropterin synthase QueD [Caldisericia bacterium]